MPSPSNDQLASYTRKGKLSTQQITIMAILLAFRIMLAFIPALQIAEIAKMGFAFIGNAVSAAILGPWWNFVHSAFNDVIVAFLKGYQFFLGYTLSDGLAGVIYGYFFFRKERNLKNIVIAVFLVTVICNIGLGTLWVRILQGKAWMAILPLRIYKNIASFFLNIILLYFIFKIPTIDKLIDEHQFPAFHKE